MSDQQVELHVDAVCPWCWLTALWLYEVERVRPISVTTKVFSLAAVHKERGDALKSAERALRVLVAARRLGGEPAIRAVYRELGEAHHERSESLGEQATLQNALIAAALDPTLAEQALADDSTLSEVLAEHTGAVDRGAFGVPTLSIDGSDSFFGPIIAERITAADAGRLWDIVAPVLTEPRLFELKRNRTRKPEVGRNRTTSAGVAD
ncbi:MAG: DsbA family protein [Candidatus Dormibacteraeota bacterium]|nr:DsbA family protein [Candidatus Dormibacteraeota bacterium]